MLSIKQKYQLGLTPIVIEIQRNIFTGMDLKLDNKHAIKTEFQGKPNSQNNQHDSIRRHIQ